MIIKITQSKQKEIVPDKDVLHTSLLRQFLMEDYVEFSEMHPKDFKPSYEFRPSYAYAPIAYLPENTCASITLPVFKKEFPSLSAIYEFENSVFLNLIKTVPVYKTLEKNYFLTPAHINSCFKQIECHDLVVYSLLLSSKDENKITKLGKDFYDKDEKQISPNLKHMGYLWTANIYSTDLLPSGTAIVFPSIDTLGVYFNRPIFQNEKDQFELYGAACIVYPEGMAVTKDCHQENDKLRRLGCESSLRA